MFKLQISSIFNFDWAHQSWISGVLGVKDSNADLGVIFWIVQNPPTNKAVCSKISKKKHNFFVLNIQSKTAIF